MKLGASSTRSKQARLVASTSERLGPRSITAWHERRFTHAIGVAVVVGPGSVQVWNQSVAIYISTARASSSSTVYPLVKLTLEAVAFSASAVHAPFFNPTTEGKL